MSTLASEDEDVGPMPPPPPDNDVEPRRKRVKLLPNEEQYLKKMPNMPAYEKSYMHRDTVGIVIATTTDFIITTSSDGHLKFWRKQDKGIGFVKHFKAHSGEISGASVNRSGNLLATISRGKELRVFDVCNFDMINMIRLSFVPEYICWVKKEEKPHYTVAISDANSGEVHLLDAKGDGSILNTFKAHKHPVVVMSFNEKFNTVISVDSTGMMEYWVPEAPFLLPENAISWKFKSDTDLFTLKKCSAVPTSLSFSPDFEQFITYGLSDRQVRVWNFASGKLMRVYDESLATISEMQQAGTAVFKMDDMEFGRRLAVERELETNIGQSRYINAIFDDSGHFVLYTTLLGVKIVNLTTNRVSAIIGNEEGLRILNIALYQGVPDSKKIVTIDMLTAENEVLREKLLGDPTIFCSAYKKNRFYLFTRREPDKDDPYGRDVFNEKPTKEEQSTANLKSIAKSALAHQATIHTTLGDICLKLFPDHTPLTVENFTTHAKNCYYNGHIFHRVIKGFMVQTGDPRGDGTGGESIWGEEFKDEIVPDLRHDRPGTLSMANSGANTNGSQFFITTVPTPWLDGKHTVFGRVTAGMDVLQLIERTQADKHDKPLNDIRITNITIQKAL